MAKGIASSESGMSRKAFSVVVGIQAIAQSDDLKAQAIIGAVTIVALIVQGYLDYTKPKAQNEDPAHSA